MHSHLPGGSVQERLAILPTHDSALFGQVLEKAGFF
jgi:hypothetical protein